ncbi:Cht2 [Symbiodinium natans]|uniref:Cht2 protein n=1 Tax=Symbiodinium natans TaxID=878477 RepID=A0A812PIK5_9DINO|nr:Cht2 [Symbiodinium natans]
MTAMASEIGLSTRLWQWLLFSPGPFYFYPWKSIANHIAGDSYAIGYRHFVAGHYGRINLALHCVALFIQTFGNFRLLEHLDRLLFSKVGVLSFGSVVAWVASLASSPAPALARLASCGSLCFAFQLAPYATVESFELATPGAMALVLTWAQATAKRPISNRAYAKGLVLMAGWYAGWTLLRRMCGKRLEDQKVRIRCAVISFLSFLAMQKNPVTPVVVLGSLLCRLASILTDDPVLYYLGFAFTGSLFQGIAHNLTAEEATLKALERQGEQAKLRYEWAHVTFFPALLFHAVQEAATRSWKA